MCSNTGDAVGRIAAAIDQLARDARHGHGATAEGELAARVAGLWQLIGELDPELARRALRYAAPADSAPAE